MARQLKIWNGGGSALRKRGDPLWKDVRFNGEPHGYIAAYSRADAERIIEEYCGQRPPVSLLRDYWHEGTWGIAMDGIVPERGLWLQFNRHVESSVPIKVI
jgi:hypothetical protein